jgi:hypothetical protein
MDGVTLNDQEIYQKELLKRSMSINGSKSTAALMNAGRIIRNKLLLDGSVSKLSVMWTGNDKSASMSTVAKDIHIENLNLRISIKENADVFINGSAEKVFNHLPLGIFGQTIRGEDWFLKTARNELNEYFLACEGEIFSGHKNIEAFYRSSKKPQRKLFGSHVKELHYKNTSHVMEKYSSLCQKVSLESARIFNKNLDSFLSERKNTSAALQPIFYFFFRINGVKYILAGVENKEPFAVYMLPGDSWVKLYEFVGIVAIPLQSGQPEVLLKFTFRYKKSKETFDLDLKVEIRWSHGKFCGNPEAKVYKKWKYSSLPWSESLTD